MDQVRSISIFVLTVGISLPFLSLLLRDRPRERKIIGFLMLLVYVYGNLSETLIGRTVSEEIKAHFDLFWSYREAFSWTAEGLEVSKPTMLVQIILNVLLYIPLGYLLSFIWGERFYDAGRWRGLWRTVQVGFLCSLLTELTQLVFRLGLFEFDDMLHNTLGAALGYILYRSVMRVMDSDDT